MSRPRKTYDVKGEMITVHEASERSGVPVSTLKGRMRQQGMTLAQAIVGTGIRTPAQCARIGAKHSPWRSFKL